MWLHYITYVTCVYIQLHADYMLHTYQVQPWAVSLHVLAHFGANVGEDHLSRWTLHCWPYQARRRESEDHISLHPLHGMRQASAVQARICRATILRVRASEVPKESRRPRIRSGELWNVVRGSSAAGKLIGCCWRAWREMCCGRACLGQRRLVWRR